MNKRIKAHWERCPVPPWQTPIFERYKETLAWKWRDYVIVRCHKIYNGKYLHRSERHLRQNGFLYFIIFPDGVTRIVTNQLIDPMDNISRWNLRIIQNWVLERVRELTPVDIEDIGQIYAYDE
jgi:hypothetical protein